MLHEAVRDAFSHLVGFYEGLWEPLQRLLFVLFVFAAATVLVWVAERVVMAVANRSPHVDTTLAKFIHQVLTATAIVVVALAVLLAAGVPAGTLAGLLAVGGFVVGFALKDSLGNLAAGVVLLVNRPYSLGEGVDIKGHGGVVIEFGIAATRLKTWDGRLVTVPNGAVLSDAILNHSRHPVRRADVAVGVAYGDDLDTAVRAALAAAKAHADVLTEPAPAIIVTQLGDSSVNLLVHAWVPTSEWYRAKSELTGQIKTALEAAGCTIPFPQRDVHLDPGPAVEAVAGPR